MEPDFIRDQVKNIWLVVTANAKVIKEKHLKIEGAFVDCEFVVQQAAVLYDAVSDSVNIKALVPTHAHQYIIMKPEFLSQQGKSLQTAIEDSAQLQDVGKASYSGLMTLNEDFLMVLVTNLRDVVADNVCVALQQNIQPNLLYMARPGFVERLVASFHCVMNSQVHQKRWVTSLQELRVAAETAQSEVKAQFEAAIAEKDEALSRFSALEASLASVEQERDKLQTSAKESTEAVQICIAKLEGDLARLSAEHLHSNSKVQEREAELETLKGEYKNLVKICEEQRNASAVALAQVVVLNEEKQKLQQDLDRLATELGEVQENSQTFAFARAQEHEQMKIEIARLEGVLKTRVAEMNLEAEKRTAQLKASLDAAKAELLTADNQLSATIVQCDTWKSTLDDIVTRQATEMEEVRQAAAREKEIADGLLDNAAKKIEELEVRLRQKDTEVFDALK
ncbi:hypothetical protein BC628DRAFT_889289 [Trametes gibbosa]|nr:hypothetical protein BC628DRAFT_889289 [Trametes gibbosa]